MWLRHHVFARCVAVALAVAATAPALAQPAATHVSSGGTKIQIKTCSPTRNVTAMPARFAPGYYPGFFPGRGYFWDDPYGFPYYQPPLVVNASAALQIDYVNVTPATMETIDFGLIANGRLVAEVRDVGTFSPNIEIKHSFGLNPNVFPLGTALPKCVPLRITYKDQATWVNPHLPHFERQLYGSN
jgi:hypothetical protein